MKKFVLAVFLAAIAFTCALAITPSHATATASIGVASSTQQFPNAKVGDTIHVNITITDVQNLWLWDITDLTFNPSVLSLTGVSEGPFLESAGQTLFIWTSNSNVQFSEGYIPEISDTLLELTNMSGTGVLATLSFKVLSTGTSQITFNQTSLESTTNLKTMSAPPISSAVSNVNLSIGVPGSSATSTPTSGTTSNPSPSAATSTSSDPSGTSPTPDSAQAPEFPAISIPLVLAAAAAISMALTTKRAKKKA
jgi:hypothetical protein